MNKKFFVSLTIILSIVFSFSICFAETNNGTSLGNMVNGVRNFVGGTENTMENVASGVSNTSQNMTGNFENTMSGNHNTDTMGMTDDDNDNNHNGNVSGTGDTSMGMTHSDDDNTGYIATRTATGTDDATVLGMTSTAWTWIILGIAAIGIIAIVWYYSSQFTNNNNNIDRE